MSYIHSGEDAGGQSTKNAQDLAQILSNPVVVATADTTVTAAQNGTVFQIATDAKVFTLPAAQAGLEYTFQNTGAGGAVLLSILPQTGEKIHYITSVATKKLLNTKATAVMGDHVTLYSDGTGWYPKSLFGTWAKEA
jgi:hypothetical protein